MILGWILCVAVASIEVDTPPVLGAETVVVLRDAQGNGRGGETVRVIHRPGLGGEREVAVGITDGLGRVRWTPEVGGVARLEAGEEQLRTVVAQPPPAETVVGLILLFLCGVAGIFWGVGFGRQT